MYGVSVMREIVGLLYWSMLAACTVGPGTVVTCARAGAEYGLSLTWSLFLASILAYILLEASARLTIVSGLSLGQCLQVKYKNGRSLWNTAIICWVVVTSIYLGNQFYELNTFAGGLDAVLAMPGASSLTGQAAVVLRVGTCLGYAVVVLSLLWFDKTETLGIFLGFTMMGMVGLFLVVVVKMDLLTMGGVLTGFVPNIPIKADHGAEPTDLILSLVGTTAVGFNLFLGGAMAKGRNLSSAQRGIAFSCCAAFLVSELILMVGAGHYIQRRNINQPPTTFTIQQLTQFVAEYTGTAGTLVFAIGFVAAALSSQLATPLGATATAESIFFRQEPMEGEDIAEQGILEKEHTVLKEEQKTLVAEKKEIVIIEKRETVVKIDTSNVKEKRNLKIMKQTTNFVMVGIATVVISTNVDRILVILVAQVFNGCLLPIFSVCLLLCINDEQFMLSAPQKGWSNVFLVTSVTFTMFLAGNVLVEKTLSWLLATAWHRLLAAGCLAGGGIITVCTTTGLGRTLLHSLYTH